MKTVWTVDTLVDACVAALKPTPMPGCGRDLVPFYNDEDAPKDADALTDSYGTEDGSRHASRRSKAASAKASPKKAKTAGKKRPASARAKPVADATSRSTDEVAASLPDSRTPSATDSNRFAGSSVHAPPPQLLPMPSALLADAGEPPKVDEAASQALKRMLYIA
ncbi:unnamed protein product [Pedinophyceae sp. YPF-701]|nr:unnamed protein product [Pedinophyceae sp. YPF-701]